MQNGGYDSVPARTSLVDTVLKSRNPQIRKDRTTPYPSRTAAINSSASMFSGIRASDFEKFLVFNVDLRTWHEDATYNKALKFDLGKHTTADVIRELDVVENVDFRLGWKKATSFPSEIHVELLSLKAIPDPYVGFNEHKVQWIGDAEWLYQCTFPFDLSIPHQYAKLIFEGLDTICDVYLNNSKILATDNVFRTYAYEIPQENLLRSNNTLLLHFKSAKALRSLKKPSMEGSAPVQPTLEMLVECMTQMGLDVHVRNLVEFQPDGAFTVTLKLDVALSGAWDASGNALLVQLANAEQSPGKFQRNSVVMWTNLENDGIQLWWPVGYGEQTLYRVEVSLVNKNDEVIDSASRRVGFRTVKLIQEPLSEPDQYGLGTTFLFEINNVRMFMGGSNWIPADNFLTQISAERYRKWLTLLRDGNQNMVRIWGGGMYEPDVFYDICDELGILVWQDFQFACGVYPAHEEFVANVRQEAIDNVTRLRHHPSIVCYCGNNEDYQLVLQWGDVAQLPARILYEDVLPDIVATLTDPPVPYHRGSPYGGKGWDTSDPTIGDVHQWNIWGGKELQYQEYDRMGGRFISEFGIPSMPSMRTVNYWMAGADESQFYPQSQLVAQHTKAGSFERRFAIVMNENFRLTTDFETHVFSTQLMQSEATSGVLVWQLNDCWPVVSWAIADYFLRPKPVYYTIKRELAPVTVGIFRNVVKNRENDRPRQFYEFGAIQTLYATLSIWATNSTLTVRKAKLELRFFDLLSPGWSHSETQDVNLLPNQSTELLEIECPGPSRNNVVRGEPLSVSSANVVVSARLLDAETGVVLARHSDWPEPYRYLQTPDPGLITSLTQGERSNETTLTMTVSKPAKCVFFSVEDAGPEVQWSDNALDLVPGDEQVVLVGGLNGRKVKVAYFGRQKAQVI
ncbi:glycoside hydrolase superfamily [Gymnopilus junonius]|uniref:Beta-mannosidase B n=1 Tax=Gymnopilus junonius TaxID=109634 RepID=A0A9P5NN37_GYMJU|nr:glycoside hydrolase superfamily [Gymnopilus junonius]